MKKIQVIEAKNEEDARELLRDYYGIPNAELIFIERYATGKRLFEYRDISKK